jgi:uncharacterized protein (TIGR02001 family)
MRAFRKSPVKFVSLCLLALSAGWFSCSAAAGEWTGSLALTSDYRVHGLQRSAGAPAAQAHLGFIGERGWSAGAWASTMELHTSSGPSQELDFYAAAYSQLSRDWRIAGLLTHYEFLNDSYDYTEIAATASFRDALSVTVAAAPQYSFYGNGYAARDRTAVNYEVSGRHSLSRHVQLTAGIGYSDLQDLFSASHWYWSGGAELGLRHLSLGLSYIGTDSTAKSLFGPKLAGNALIATLAYRLL